MIPYAEFDQEQYMVRIESSIVHFGISTSIANQATWTPAVPANQQTGTAAIPAMAIQLWQAPSALYMKTRGLCVPRCITDGSTDTVCQLISTKNGSGNDQVLDLAVGATTPTMATYTAPGADPVKLFDSYKNVLAVQKRALYGENYCIETLGDVVCNTNLTFEFQWSVDMAPRSNGVLIPFDAVSAIPLAPTIDMVLLFYPNPNYNKNIGHM